MKMDLTNYAKYGISLMTSQSKGVEYYMVTLIYGKKWTVKMPTETPNPKVMCAKVKDDGTYCYITEIANGLEPVFDLIDKTIQYNEELEKKVDLFKVKAEELKELFANLSYDELLRLKFTIETPQLGFSSKNKRSTKSGRKTSQKANETAITEKNEGQLPSDNNPTEEDPKKTVIADPCENSEIDKKIAEAMNKK